MPRYIAFLRAINVGGRIVKMDALRGHFEALGLARVETFIASGNVIFDAPAKAIPKLQARIEAGLEAALGFEAHTFLRTDTEVASIAGNIPFPLATVDAAPTLCVGFMVAPLGREAQRRLQQFKTEIDDFRVQGREVYWLCRNKQSESTFNNAAFEKALHLRSTFRGINTIRKLAAKYAPA